MISTNTLVPLVFILICLGSSSWTSLFILLPTLAIRAGSAGLFMFPFISLDLTTKAFNLLSLNTVPVPPRPACFTRTFLRRLSYRLKFRQPIKVLSEPRPAVTEEIFCFLPSSANISKSSSARMWVSTVSIGASMILTFPSIPSTYTITSLSDFP